MPSQDSNRLTIGQKDKQDRFRRKMQKNSILNFFSSISVEEEESPFNLLTR